MPLGAAELLPLAAFVVPIPDRTVTEVALKRLDGMRSLLALLSFPRIMGWADPVVHAQQFKLLSDVVGQVPVYQAWIPWGPPFPAGVVQGIFEGTGAGPAVKEAREGWGGGRGRVCDDRRRPGWISSGRDPCNWPRGPGSYSRGGEGGGYRWPEHLATRR